MAQIRLTKTVEIEELLNKYKPYFRLSSEGDILKILAGLGAEIFEKRILMSETEDLQANWNKYNLDKLKNWEKEEQDTKPNWNLNNLKPLPKLPKKQDL